MQQKVYDSTFFENTSQHSAKSAKLLIPVIKDLLPDIKSVVDFGCAQGVWLKTWNENGANEILGIDGDYVDRSDIVIPLDRFIAKDLNEPIRLGKKFDLAYSLEVAEHLQPDSSEHFIDSLTKHSDIVLFSAATPGQGGEMHINEKPLDSWRRFFQTRGYDAFDCIRPKIAKNFDVSYWYRYNTILYVHEDALTNIPESTLTTKISRDVKIKDVSPPLFRIRKKIIRLLPLRAQNQVAKIKNFLSVKNDKLKNNR